MVLLYIDLSATWHFHHHHHLSVFSINNLYILTFNVVTQRVIVNRQGISSLVVASMNISEIGTELLKAISSTTRKQLKTRSDRVICATTCEEMAQVMIEQSKYYFLVESCYCT
jgi:hypothetical protein